MENGLFRRQALDAVHKRLYGEISLAQPLSLYLVILALLVCVALLLIFLHGSEYARKETVRGYLLPESGMLKSFPMRSGVIAELHVGEGDRVDAGQALALVTIQTAMASGQELSERVLDSLASQRQILEQERAHLQRLHDTEMERLSRQYRSLHDTLAISRRQQGITEQRIELLQDESTQYASLHDRGYLSDADLQSQRQKLLSAEQALEEVNSRVAAINTEMIQVESEISSRPIELDLRLADISRQLADTQRQLDETRSKFQFVVSAPESGTVAAVSVVEGEFIARGRPLLSIIPSESQLVAELLLPTRAAGFVRKGDEVRLRFEAFPYQRFGVMQSTVAQVDKAVVLAGESSLPVQLGEPVYRVRAYLAAQSVRAYGDVFALKSGMLLEADIVLDRRSLFDWLLDPIYSLKGRAG